MTRRRQLLRTMTALAGLGGGAAGLAACTRTQPLENVENREFIGPGTLAQRANQIRRAGAGRGWQVEEIRPGLIRARLYLRDHVAVVDIPYDTQRFSIRYADSRNLLYDGTSIHRNYNSWVRLLANDIVAQPPV
ncbi:hypothetical protein [Caldovatus aquaticus]|uniref:Lipoprotein n=1 Tax=Caldovatus aquaticus TaxID=2865671 RepID=A0ABS7F2A3_9PROT|nr:hypothetical protein [Caldovatus aquaticus]MBW8269733.1 hypothetical protein [Caldovatus aquaticus]